VRVLDFADLLVSDRGLSKEHKDLETLHELKGPMTRSRVKLLQEEMAKRIKDGLLIKGMEREKSQEAELEHVED